MTPQDLPPAPTPASPGASPGCDPDAVTAVPGSAPRSAEGAAGSAGEAPRRLGRYELIELLGRGGGGAVWSARHTGLGKVVALKVLEGGSEGEVARFAAEARVVAELAHPGIVPVHDVGQEGERWFMAMDLVPGGVTLAHLLDADARARVARGTPAVPVARALALVEEVARAVGHAHARGVVHRDLKPGNVLLAPGDRPLVADFGLARRLDAPHGITRTGEVLGTPAYMPPEQAAGGTPGEPGDIWGLGAILHALLLAEPPVPASGNLAQDLVRAARGEPVTPRRRLPGLHADLETILLRALDRDPARRYPTALALAEDLRRHRSGEPILARRPPLLLRAGRWARRRRTGVLLALAGAAAAAASLGLLAELSLGWRSWEEVADLRFEGRGDADGLLPLEGEWSHDGGALRVQGGTPARAALAEGVAGDLRVELEAALEPLPGRRGGDLSVALLPPGGGLDDGYFVGFGSDGNTVSKVLRRGRRVAVARGEAARVTPGRTHRVRVERAGGLLTLDVDDRPVLAWRDLSPLDLGAARVVVYTWEADLRLRRLRVWRRPAAVKARRADVASWLLEEGQADAAALLYADIARDPALDPEARREALLLQAMAELTAAGQESDPRAAADRVERARALLAPLAGPATPEDPLGRRARLGLAEADLLEREVGAGLARLPPPGGADEQATRDLLARAEAALLRAGAHEERLAVVRAARARLGADEAADGQELLAAEVESLLELGRAGEAAAALDAALAAADDPPLRVARAFVARRAGDLERARRDLTAAAAATHDPAALDAWLDLLDLELTAGDPAAAEQALAAALRAAGARPEGPIDALSVSSARQTLQRGEPAPLEDLARRGLAARAGEARAWGTAALLALACARLEAGDTPGARAWLDQVPAAWPDGPGAPAPAWSLLLGAALDLRAGAREAGREKARAVEQHGARWPLLRELARALTQDALPERAAELRARAGDVVVHRAIVDALAGAVDPDPERAGAALAAARDATAGPAWARAVGRALGR